MSVPGPKPCANHSIGAADTVSSVGVRHTPLQNQRGLPVVEKPLLYSLFAKCCCRIANDEAKCKDTVQASSSEAASPAAAAAAGNSNNNNNNNTNSEDVTQPRSQSPFLCNVLQLDTAGTEAPCYSRSGRQLSECEALHKKHAKEYRYLYLVLAEALTAVVAAHGELAQHQVAVQLLAATKECQRQLAGGDAHDSEEATAAAAAALARSSPQSPALFEGFVTSEVPKISLHNYLVRLVRYTYASPSVLVIAFLYLDRLLLLHDSLLLTELTVFKLLTASLRIASKVYDTRTLSNKDFAHITGVTAEELAVLETDFLTALRFDLYVSAEEFNGYTRDLVVAAEKGELASQRHGMPPSATKHSRRPARRLDSGSACSFVSRSSASVYALTTPPGPAPPSSASNMTLSCGTGLDDINRGVFFNDSAAGSVHDVVVVPDAGASGGDAAGAASGNGGGVADPLRRHVTQGYHGSGAGLSSSSYGASTTTASMAGKPPKASTTRLGNPPLSHTDNNHSSSGSGTGLAESSLRRDSAGFVESRRQSLAV